MSKDKQEFNFNKYWGPAILKPFVDYSREDVHYCIYCGAIVDTQERVPSKVYSDSIVKKKRDFS